MSDLAAGMANLYKLKPKEEVIPSGIPGTAVANIQAGQASVPAPQIATNQGGAQAAIDTSNPKITVITQPEGGGVSNLESQKKDITKDRPELYDKNVTYGRNVPDATVIAAKELPAGVTQGEATTTSGLPKAQVQQAVTQEAVQAKKEKRGFDWGLLAKLGIGLADIIEAWGKGVTHDTTPTALERRKDVANKKASEEAERAFMEKMAKAQNDYQVARDNARNATDLMIAERNFAHQQAMLNAEKGNLGAGTTPASYYGAGSTVSGGTPYIDPAKIVSQYQAPQTKPATTQIGGNLTPEQKALVESQGRR